MSRGGAREGAGRKSKEQETALLDKLSPYDALAFEKLIEGIKEGQFKYLKLFFEYRFGRPIPLVPEAEKVEPLTINYIVPSDPDHPDNK